MHLGGRSVSAPDGARWRVARRWIGRGLPRWRRVHAGDAALEALSTPDGDDLATSLAIAVGALVVAVILIPLLLFGAEMIVLGLLIAGGILGRSLLGRPWVVQAVDEHDRRLSWQVSGWRRSARLIEEVAGALEHGRTPTPSEGSPLRG
jgi:hypothetical protein